MGIKISEMKSFDAAEWIDTPEDVASHLNAAFETGDKAYILHALNVVARSKGMAAIAAKTGRGRESLYKSFREGAKPSLAAVLDVLAALDLRLGVKTCKRRAAKPAKASRMKPLADAA